MLLTVQLYFNHFCSLALCWWQDDFSSIKPDSQRSNMGGKDDRLVPVKLSQHIRLDEDEYSLCLKQKKFTYLMSGEVYTLPSVSTCIIITHEKKAGLCLFCCGGVVLFCFVSPCPQLLSFSVVWPSHKLSFADVRDQSDNHQAAAWHEIQIEDIQCQHPDVDSNRGKWSLGFERRKEW